MTRLSLSAWCTKIEMPAPGTAPADDGEMSGDVATPDDTTDTPDAGIEMTCMSSGSCGSVLPPHVQV